MTEKQQQVLTEVEEKMREHFDAYVLISYSADVDMDSGEETGTETTVGD